MTNETMGIVVRSGNMLETIDDVLFAAPDIQEAWLRGVGELLLDIGHLHNRTKMEESRILWTIHNVWVDKGSTEGGAFLSREATSPWAGDYMTWAKRYTQTTATEPKEDTIKLKISVYETWVQFPNTGFRPDDDVVFLPERADDGQKIDDPDKWDEHDFDPMEIDYAKLLAARPVARQGKMTPEAWSALADPLVSKRSLDAELRKVNSEDDEVEDDKIGAPSIWCDEGILYVTFQGETVAFARLLSEELEHPLANEAAKQLLATFGIKLSADLFSTPDIEVNAPVAVQNKDTVVISRHGSRFIEVSNADELCQLIEVCEHALTYNAPPEQEILDTLPDEPNKSLTEEEYQNLTADETICLDPDDDEQWGW